MAQQASLNATYEALKATYDVERTSYNKSLGKGFTQDTLLKRFDDFFNIKGLKDLFENGKTETIDG